MSESQFLAGFQAVQARLRHHPESIKEIFFDQKRRDKRIQQLVDRAQSVGLKLTAVTGERLDELAKGIRHQGVLAFASHTPLAVTIDDVLDVLEEPAFLLILDGVTDPHNLGACLRAADAAGVHAVIAPKDRAVGLNATVRRVSCGAAETVPYITVTNLARTMRALRERDVWLVGTADEVEGDLHSIDAKRSMAWVMGAEGEGMRRLTQETCDELVSIPMAGTVESLNVSVASAVCLYETVRQRKVL